MSIKGLDVSEFQGIVDWAQVKGAGYQFAMLPDMASGRRTSSSAETRPNAIASDSRQARTGSAMPSARRMPGRRRTDAWR